MEVRLNKLISDSGLCSRREADKFIEEGRVTVNGSLPHVGQKVTEADIVMLDDIRIKVGKHASEHAPVARGKAQELVFSEQEKKAKKEKSPAATASEKKTASPSAGSKGLRPGKYAKYNKYAAARHAARDGEKSRKEGEKSTGDKDLLKEALRPKFGKSLGRSAVAQRLASSPKSAALRKTSKNNPLNKAKHAAARNKPKGE
ncbi:S4 domain-containing protein [uncultured Parabacteroides sp.]|uniref:S4 domain-containing protein n=1 Tax=uncultured Parabacteroides sp. TaxID=512312 RepID=UPI0025EF573A|nr:S4 domain-containing protein [uncultured Parabacteroides sp.]